VGKPDGVSELARRDQGVVFENGYEAQAWREIQDWEQRPDAALRKALRGASRPVTFAADKALTHPVMGRTVERMAEGMRAASMAVGARADVDKVLRRASARSGRPVRDLDDLRALDLRTLDQLAARLDRPFIAAASASGGAAGATATLPGGSLITIGALSADVVASTALMLKAITAYGTQYGRDVSVEQEAHFAIGVLSLGAVTGDAQVRGVLLSEIHSVSALLARGATWSELSRHTSVKALQLAFDKLGLRLTKRKLAQVVPFFGAAAGGTLGAAMADHTCQAAYMQYRRRYLLDKYPGLAGL
jgi:hypothetical protein